MRRSRPGSVRGEAGLLLVVLLLGCWRVSADAGQISEAHDSFNGYTLASPLTAYPAFTLIESWSGDFVKQVGVYEQPGEALVLNGVAFKRIRYRFADERLESIHLTFEGRDNRDRLMQWLEEHYGKLMPAERKVLRQVLWQGDHLTITLSYNSVTKSGALWFASPALANLVNKMINDMPD